MKKESDQGEGFTLLLRFFFCEQNAYQRGKPQSEADQRRQ
jgi:hypothetical protein